MNLTYYVRASLYDYEHGYSQLSRSFDTIDEARTFRDKVAAHIAFTGSKGTAHPSLRGPRQEEDETDEAFNVRECRWQTQVDQHHNESLNWFSSGHGYFTSAPVIVKRAWEETVVT